MSTNDIPKITIPHLQTKKENGEKIVALTAYDFPTARLVEEAGIDMILVGDSLGMVVLGYENTIPVTMDEMLHHTKAVSRAAQRSLIVGDMPYFSFHLSVDETVLNASRFLKEAGAHAVKIEGATEKRLELIKNLVDVEIPVMGHVGLTPQSIYHLGQFKVRGKEVEEAKKIMNDSLSLEKAGVFAIVLECVPMELAREITQMLKIPTIGIGAGAYCDGQILVFHDLVGYADGYLPKFVKRYADLHDVLGKALKGYAEDVRRGEFPDDSHSYHFKKKDILEKILKKDEE
ncbi:3-methyl-2-oxobutanoate hydroxymethyltransferase [candidate division WOR-1 bacterium DG_54_3]|uniref:3-methyl-2-oxobutanoate hydroxymethyltransferase n=1 Tax=candidate division WOR-1 bacterium DG_54_3 TaxID=1703775 RepID=A0A0S7Y7G8_UNCSA|nr:MAG: 3-methyl-2-oxobutanoate hydroxymethyltransferase [candidate division WOR-1 bacterium DG_54_3]